MSGFIILLEFVSAETDCSKIKGWNESDFFEPKPSSSLDPFSLKEPQPVKIFIKLNRAFNAYL